MNIGITRSNQAAFVPISCLLAGLFMSKRTNIARAFRPRLIGYTIMMLSNDRYISNTVLIHSILVPQMQIMVTIAGDKEIP